MRNYNTLIGRYDGADGMKTGFICASGFNVVASATRNGKRLIAVVLGSPSSAVRAVKAARLLERGFKRGPLSWLTPSLGSVEALPPVNAAPPNLRDEMCGKNRKRPPPKRPTTISTGTGGLAASCCRACRQGSDKPSGLLARRLRPPIRSWSMPARQEAGRTQFAATRARLAKTGKLARAVPTAPAPAPAAAPRHRARFDGEQGPPGATCRRSQTAAAALPAPAGCRRRPPARVRLRRPTGSSAPARAMPGATDAHNPSLDELRAGGARSEPAPLTATPDARSGGRWRRPAAAAAAQAYYWRRRR